MAAIDHPRTNCRLGATRRIGYPAGMREATDEQLMQNYANGDAMACERLYARHRGPLYRYIHRQIKDPASSNDLYQGVWEKIIGERRSYRPALPFAAWMFRIAHKHLIDFYRCNRVSGPLIAEALPAAQPEPLKP